MYEALRNAASLFVTSFETLEDDIGPMPATTECRPDQAMRAGQLRDRLRNALATLPDNERTLLMLHYHDERTLQDAGAELGISKSWASRVHRKALQRMRRALDRQAA